eukprot:TRINITY_DN2584_c0_g1_i12.p1 TRINITY_DN2584_c0_g1~~TRINITY_DN2584_c0_g1_i12.p1  ORF type:complete len:314 (+),score=36.90 TRINITY_DN2584_c0_g1_i12:522-1463(+)
MDIQFELRGIRPITQAISGLCPGGIEVNPNQDVIDYYLQRKTQFQLISVVMNCASFEQTEAGSYGGVPYSVRLFPATKRGGLDQRDISSVAFFDLEELPFDDTVFAGFDPFEGTWELVGAYSLFAAMPELPFFSDSIGFVIGQFFLATDSCPDDAIMAGPMKATPELWMRFHKFRSKRYYTPFADTKPRPIWGVESPIELYLFQALLGHGTRPIPQVRIYRDGSIYASFHDMFRDDVFKSDKELATTPDFYFPDKRVAVYCVSGQYHRSAKAKKKDDEISERVRTLGITPVRISGKAIIHDLDKAVSEVLAHL